MKRPAVQAFFDEASFTVSYVVWDPDGGQAAVVDPVLDYDPASGRSAHDSAERLLAFVAERGLTLGLVLETHVHADHLSAAALLRERTGAPVAIGEHIDVVQRSFGRIFNEGPAFARDGRQFDRLLADGERFAVGGIEARAMHTPGHTPACMVYVIGDAAFVGDTLFMPDYGTARCDFPGGDARTLYRSIQRIFALPPQTRLFLCHDYKAPGRDHYAWETTVAEQRERNLHVRDGIDEDAFVAMRESRDATLGVPRLLLPAVQVNMRAGEAPPPEDNGVRYLKIPFDAPWDADGPIYKILGAGEWREAEAAGAFTGSEVDRADGYIHFSTAAQVRETAAKHFAGQPDLVLLRVDPARLPAQALRWEPSRGGALFPHLYAPLPVAGVTRVDPLPLDGEGHRFPDDLAD